VKLCAVEAIDLLHDWIEQNPDPSVENFVGYFEETEVYSFDNKNFSTIEDAMKYFVSKYVG
jgi:hypothetical protein